MPYSLKTFECGTCGGPAQRRAAASATVYCVPCAIARAGEAAWQLHRKEGPFYERYRWNHRLGMRRRWNAWHAARAAEAEQQHRSAA